ncbi:MAG: SDR family NAD(P)-dependent oxidoreductase [Pseudomonadota bacterium]
MNRLTDRVAHVTGAGNGIGRASALRFAAEGARVMCSDVDSQAAEATAQMIEEAGGVGVGIGLDVSNESEVRHALQETLSRFGALDVLFNNAGIGGGHGWDRTLAVNLSGVFYGLKHGAETMAANGGGAIVNTASVAGLLGLALPPADDEEPAEEEASGDAGAYVAAKHGVVGLTRQFALQFGSLGVRVNAIAPGFIETAMTEGFRETEEGRDYLISLHPQGRLGRAEEIASAAAFLASDDASFVNGVVLPVDGGYSAR